MEMNDAEKRVYEEAVARIKEAAKDERTELDLRGMGLTKLPGEIGQLTRLMELHLENNRLTALPKEIGKLVNLTVLRLDGNQLTALPGEIGQLTSLRELYLYHNQLKELPGEIGKLTSLEVLKLYDNQVTALAVEIGQLTRLEVLYLDKNRLTELPVEIGQLTSLKELDLSYNQLTALPGEIGQLTSLMEFWLGGNRLAALPGEIEKLKNLEELWLNDNRLTALPREIGQLTRMTRLDLDDNRLTALPVELGRLEKLERLELGGNPLEWPPMEVVNRGTKAVLAYLREQVGEEPSKKGAKVSEGDDELPVIMGYAKKEAMRMGLDHVGSESVLMGILRADVGIGAEVLKQFKIDPEEVRHRIVIKKPPKEKTVGKSRRTEPTKKIIEYAREKSLQRGKTNVGSEYVLLGILRLPRKEPSALALQILQQMGVNLDEMRRATLALMGEKPGEEIGVALEVEGEDEVGGKMAVAEGSEVRVVNVIGDVATIRIDDIGNEDRLGREKLVKTLAEMFAQTDCKNGFTMALLGDWGEGKSTVMGLLQTELKKKHKGKFDFASYNAWEYENTDNIAAGLSQEVVKGLKRNLGWLHTISLVIWFNIIENCWNLLGLILFGIGSYVLYIYLNSLGFSFKGEMLLKEPVGTGLLGLGGLSTLIYLIKTLRNIIGHPLPVNLEKYFKLPNYAKHLGLIPVLKRHITTLCKLKLNAIRIPFTKIRFGQDKKLLVFVDDLDRCKSICIAETLDAIRLVMTIPNVIVMIGIDHRIAFKAIRKHYEELADGKDRKEAAEIARDYLGKIIQLPVRLRAASYEELEGYVFEKLFDKKNIVDDSTPGGKLEIKEVDKKPVEDRGLTRAVDRYGVDTEQEVGEGGETVAIKEDAIETTKTIEDKIEEEINEAIKDTISERRVFYELVGTFGFSNPRQLLRLHNSFRFLKGFGSGKGEGYDTLDMLRMLFWQEFLHNWPREVRNRCMAVLVNKKHTEKVKPEVRGVLENVRGDIIKLFSDEKYKGLAEFVRIVVLPHNEEGVFDSREEIDEWLRGEGKGGGGN
jgi:hypothetical protein